ncbi:hypothetical protein SNE40_022925 [Patella caerulea]
MFCIVITSTYIGNLTAKLSERKQTKPFYSIEELVHLSDWKWGLVGGSLMQTRISQSTDEGAKRFWEKLIIFNRTDHGVLNGSKSYHINRVRKEQYAFLVHDAKHIALNDKKGCFEFIEVNFPSLSSVITLNKDSYLTNDLMRAMHHLSTSGMLQNIEDEYYKDARPFIYRFDVIKKTTIGIEDLKGLVIILGVGVGIALIVLIVEFGYSVLKQKKCEYSCN